ncbi:MAG: hypothetical protein WC511_03940 [Candidatus Pacearchaeota archaeon]
MKTTEHHFEFGREYFFTYGEKPLAYLETNKELNSHTFASRVLFGQGIEIINVPDGLIEGMNGATLILRENNCGYHNYLFSDSTDEKIKSEFSRLDKLLQEAAE